MGGLDQPGQVNHRVSALEQAGQSVVRDIRLGPVSLGRAPLRPPAGHPEDRGHPRILGQRGDHAGANVPGGAEHHHPHPPLRGAAVLTGHAQSLLAHPLVHVVGKLPAPRRPACSRGAGTWEVYPPWPNGNSVQFRVLSPERGCGGC
jgi:hypothetical protein